MCKHRWTQRQELNHSGFANASCLDLRAADGLTINCSWPQFSYMITDHSMSTSLSLGRRARKIHDPTGWCFGMNMWLLTALCTPAQWKFTVRCGSQIFPGVVGKEFGISHHGFHRCGISCQLHSYWPWGLVGRSPGRVPVYTTRLLSTRRSSALGS